MAENAAKPVISIPTPESESPPWLRVGVLAGVGLAVGLLWPRVVGLKLGPTAPADVASANLGQAPAAGAVPRAGVPGVLAATTAAGVASTAAVPGALVAKAAVVVGHGYAVSCRAADGDVRKGKACDTKGLDAVAMPKLGALGTCPNADEADGKLSVVLSADFKRGQLSVDIGKSSTLKPGDALLACVKAAAAGIELKNVAHSEDRAVVAYSATFSKLATPVLDIGTASAPAAAVVPNAAAAGIEAEVGWEVALVRESPKTGAIVARLRRGTKLHTLGEPQESWYRVRFGEDTAAKDGWVYRGAIGK